MPNPQQPELGRSRLGATSDDSAKSKVSDTPSTSGGMGPIPEDNLPGHHPEVEQDKPTGPPPVPPPVEASDEDEGGGDEGGSTSTTEEVEGAAAATADTARAAASATGDAARSAAAATADAAAEATDRVATALTDGQRNGHRPEASPAAEADDRGGRRGGRTRFRFSFEPRVVPVAAAFGVTPFTAWVDVDDEHLTLRFGPWSLRTELDNVEGAERTGPYSFLKVAGPPHLSFADRGVTFATSTREGVCVRFRRPVEGALPFGLLRHPAATFTVEDPEGFIGAVTDDD